jgi:GNAT superfamily N-acetyltransferase
MSVEIRRYQQKDLEQCRDLWKELTERHREIYNDPTIGGAQPEQCFDKHLAEVGSDSIWVAVHDFEVVGFTGLIVKGGEAKVEPVIVSQSHRGKGIGKALVQTVITEAKQRGIRFLNVAPVARNAQAIEFFYKQGFTKIGQIELFIDFSNSSWKRGLELFGCQFDY